MNKLEFLIKKLHDDVQTPTKNKPQDSGFDVYAHSFKKAWCVPGHKEVMIEADERGMIPGLTEPKPVIAGTTPEEIRNNQSPDCIWLNSGERAMIGLGFQGCVVGDPADVYELQARPRSGTSSKKGLVVTNTPGTIDYPFRGEFCIFITNTSNNAQKISLGDRVAQLVPMKVPMPTIRLVDELDDTDRGDKGFGSSGD